jgi:2-amino-4-hydroxy-6-hydroxymethyldihydropteridine diphosphokinase
MSGFGIGPRSFHAWIGLGANLGDGAAALREAAQAIGQLPGTRLVAGSSLYRSRPVEATGPDYTNAMLLVLTSLGPRELLHALQRQELRQGRERPHHNAPRTLDLDVIWHGELHIWSPELVLPHPRYRQRAFVLEPLAEVLKGLMNNPDVVLESWPHVPDMAHRRSLVLAQGIEKLPEALLVA